MKKEEIKDNNPLKFAELKGRIDAMYDMQKEEPARFKNMKGC